MRTGIDYTEDWHIYARLPIYIKPALCFSRGIRFKHSINIKDRSRLLSNSLLKGKGCTNKVCENAGIAMISFKNPPSPHPQSWHTCEFKSV